MLRAPLQPIAVTLACGLAVVIALKQATKPRKQGPPLARIGFLQFMRRLVNPDTSLEVVQVIAKEGPVCRFATPWFLPECWVVQDWTLLNQVFCGSPASQSPAGDKNQLFYTGVRLFTGGTSNIVSKRTDGQGPHSGWSWVRKAAVPSLSAQNLKLRFEQAQELIWADMEMHLSKSGPPTDATASIQNLTMRFMCQAMMCGGPKDEKTGEDKMDEFIETLRVAMKEVLHKCTANPLRQFMFWREDVRRGNRAVQESLDFASCLLSNFRRNLDAQKAPSLIAALDRAPYPSDKERVADLLMFLEAGTSTTAFTAVCCLWMIFGKPSVLHRLREELDSVNPLRERWTLAQLESLNYLWQTIQETMRLYPLVPVLLRSFDQGGTISAFEIPKHSVVFCNIFEAAKSNITDRPHEFLPERWTGEGMDAAALRQQSSFAKGKRECPGRHLAYMELKLLLATFVQHLDWQLASQLQVRIRGTLEPCEAFFRVTPRGSEKAHAN